VCGNDPGSKWQQPEGKVSHESKSYFDGVMALSRGSSQNNLLSSCSIAW
jgi:hypothetical protein